MVYEGATDIISWYHDFGGVNKVACDFELLEASQTIAHRHRYLL